MGRPSLKQERRVEILKAYERCVARYGVEGATLERTAKEAGLARALLRHHVGNREELLNGLVEQFLEKSRTDTEALFAALPETNRLSTLIDWLFDPAYSNTEAVLVSEALIAASSTRPELAEKMKGWVRDFVEPLIAELQRSFANHDKETLSSVAMGVTAIYFNSESLAPLGAVPDIQKTSREAARRLVSTLETS